MTCRREKTGPVFHVSAALRCALSGCPPALSKCQPAGVAGWERRGKAGANSAAPAQTWSGLDQSHTLPPSRQLQPCLDRNGCRPAAAGDGLMRKGRRPGQPHLVRGGHTHGEGPQHRRSSRVLLHWWRDSNRPGAKLAGAWWIRAGRFDLRRQKRGT